MAIYDNTHTVYYYEYHVSLNQIQRRFLKVPARSLRYDLQQLEKKGFIHKIGTTRGAMYTAKK